MDRQTIRVAARVMFFPLDHAYLAAVLEHREVYLADVAAAGGAKGGHQLVVRNLLLLHHGLVDVAVADQDARSALDEWARLKSLQELAVNNAVNGQALNQNDALHLMKAWKDYFDALGMPKDDLEVAMKVVFKWILTNIPE